MAKKVISEAILESRRRMQEIIDNNTERRTFATGIDLSSDFGSSAIINDPMLANKIAITAAKCFGYEDSVTAVVFKSAKTDSIVSDKGTPLPRYHFDYLLEVVDDKQNAFLKSEIKFSVDTFNGFVITDYKVIKSLDSDFNNSVVSSLSFPQALGEKELCSLMRKFMTDLHKVPTDTK